MNDNQKMNWLIGLLFVILIVAVIFVAVDPAKKSNQFVYNGFVISKFRLQSAPNVIFYNIDFTNGDKQYAIPLRNNPETLESINVDNLDGIAWLRSSKEADNFNILSPEVYLTFDPNMSGGDLILAGGELVRVIGSGKGGVYGKQVAGAFTRLKEGASTPVKTCSDASSKVGIILFTLGDENKVAVENDCVVLEGKSYTDLIRVSDRFLLTLLGVIKQ